MPKTLINQLMSEYVEPGMVSKLESSVMLVGGGSPRGAQIYRSPTP